MKIKLIIEATVREKRKKEFLGHIMQELDYAKDYCREINSWRMKVE